MQASPVNVADALAGVQRLFIDTSPVIYHVQNAARYRPLTNHVFGAIRHGTVTGVTSSVTLLECPVHPYRLGDTSLADRFRRAITASPNLRYVGVDTAVERAAELRARHDLALADALQVAAALAAGCDMFLTNDHELRRVTEIRVLVLDDLTT